jgi:hypothetical protein
MTWLLVRVLHDAFYLAKDLGHGDLAWAVSGHLDRAAASLGEPAWGAVAGFVRSHAVTGERSRPRALQLARKAAQIVAPDNGESGQVYGMCHLSAAKPDQRCRVATRLGPYCPRALSSARSGISQSYGLPPVPGVPAGKSLGRTAR